MTLASIQPQPAGAFRVLLVQPNGFARQHLRALLGVETDLFSIGECARAEDVLHRIAGLDPDIVLFDCDVDGASKELMQHIGDRSGALIVASSSSGDASQAYACGAIDFLVKPVEPDRLRDALERARVWLRGRGVEPMRTAEVRGHTLARLAIRVGERIVFVRTSDIDYFESARNYVKVHVAGAQYRLRVSLRELEQRVDRSHFRRIHRSTMVNVDRIKEVQPWFGGDYLVLLRDGTQLRASRTYSAELLEPLQ